MREEDFDEGDDELEELLAEPHLPLGSVLMAHGGLLRPFGLRDPLDQLLGKGSLGAAYKVPWGGKNGSVLKLTRDPSEVDACVLLRGRESRRIVHIHGVWMLPGSDLRGLLPWFLVHRSYLHPLTDLDKMLIEIIFSLYDENDPADLTLPRSPKQHAMISKWRNYLRDALGGEMARSDEEGRFAEGVRVSSKHIKRSMTLLMQIGAAVDEMHRVGIDWEDIHSDNLMRGDDGKLVICDVGWGLLHDEEHENPDVTDLTAEEVHGHLSRFDAVPAAAP